MERTLHHRHSWRMWFFVLLIVGAVWWIYDRYVPLLNERWHGIYGELFVPEDYSIHGIDISHHQGEIDWGKLAKATIKDKSISFVFMKATEGISVVDKRFKRNFAAAEREGLLRGAYHYFSPSVAGREQARHFIRTAPLRSGDLPPVLDVEEAGSLSSGALQREVKACLAELEAYYGVKPILYTYLNFRARHLATAEFEAYPLWIAHYYKMKLDYRGTWRFWQHTDRGRVEGIRERVDLNVYNGSMYDLQQLTIR